MAAAGVIIAALIAGGASLAAAGISSAEQEEAREEAKDLSMIKRQDVLGEQRRREELTRASLAQQKRMGLRNLGFQREQAQLGRRERAEDRAYQRKADVYNNALNIINSNVGLRNQHEKYWA